MWGRVRNSSERGSGIFLSNFQKSNGTSWVSNSNGHSWDSNTFQPFSKASTGGSNPHHHLWSSVWQQRKQPTSLFVDFLPFGISRTWIHGLFSGAGKLVDVYISKKQRKNNNIAFGFVRYQRREDAMAAIKLLHGSKIRKSEIKVSLARFSRDGSSFVPRNQMGPWTQSGSQNKRWVTATSGSNSKSFTDFPKGSQRRHTVEKKVQARSTTPVRPTVLEKSDGHYRAKPVVVEANSDARPLMETMPNKIGSSSKDSQTVKVAGLMVAQPESTPFVDGDPKPTAQNNDCVKMDIGSVRLDVISNEADSEKASATPERIKPVAMGNFEKKTSVSSW
ncbi:unnamed protein product [Amaranthus hypochondriacus]